MSAGVWLGWLTMRGDDREIDRVLTNPKRRTRLHYFASEAEADRVALCGVRRPAADSHLGIEREGAGCLRCIEARRRGQTFAAAVTA